MAFSGDAVRLYAKMAVSDEPLHERITDSVHLHVKKIIGESSSPPKAESTPITVLSVGDGTGEPGVRIAQRLTSDRTIFNKDIRVVSAELNPDMSAEARRAARQIVPTLRIVGEQSGSSESSCVAIDFLVPLDADSPSALQQNFPDGSVDVVVFCFSLMFVRDREACLRQVARMLRPGGIAIVAALHRNFGFIPFAERNLNKVVRQLLDFSGVETTFLFLSAHDDALVLLMATGGPRGRAFHDYTEIPAADTDRIRVAPCLALSQPGMVEGLFESAGLETLCGAEEGTMKYPLTLSADVQEALDMIETIMAEDGWAQLAELSKKCAGGSGVDGRDLFRKLVGEEVRGGGAECKIDDGSGEWFFPPEHNVSFVAVGRK